MSAPDFTLDVGNSTIGVGRWHGDTVEVTTVVEAAEAAELLQLIGDARVVAVSVHPDRLRAVLAGLPAARVDDVTILRDSKLPLADPRLATTAGADRIANAWALLPGPGVAVDAGTAVTVDILDGEGRYAGGFIAAGPAIAGRGLAEATAQLPHLDGKPVAIAPAGETHGALGGGLWGMAVGGTDRLVEEALATLPAGARVVATGAWGAAWAADSRRDDIEVDPYLVHRGMRAWAMAASVG